MPLAFQSLSHGTITFGFFNIESDMLLLDRYFISIQSGAVSRAHQICLVRRLSPLEK
jgi:hypothetical protein